jgi:hypothetical protein
MAVYKKYFYVVNESYAVKVVDETFEKVELLEILSEVGNMLKDVNVSFIREIYVW